MRSTTATQPRAKRTPELRGACEKSARSVISVIHRATPGKTSHEALTDLVDSLTGVIEQSAELLLAGKRVRVIEEILGCLGKRRVQYLESFVENGLVLGENRIQGCVSRDRF